MTPGNGAVRSFPVLRKFAGVHPATRAALRLVLGSSESAGGRSAAEAAVPELRLQPETAGGFAPTIAENNEVIVPRARVGQRPTLREIHNAAEFWSCRNSDRVAMRRQAPTLRRSPCPRNSDRVAVRRRAPTLRARRGARFPSAWSRWNSGWHRMASPSRAGLRQEREPPEGRAALPGPAGYSEIISRSSRTRSSIVATPPDSRRWQLKASTVRLATAVP